MSSQSVKQVIAGGIGLIYAVVYGLWTIMATGGGHGNFIWFMLFLYVDLGGFYFPAMAVLMVSLYDRSTLKVFGILGLLNLVGSIVLIAAWMLGGWSTSSFDRQHPMSASQLIFCGFLHFLPTVIFLFKFYNVRRYGTARPNEEGSSLNLN